MSNTEENIQKAFKNLSYLDKDTFKFIATDEATSLTNSKIGGTPYIPKNACFPQNAKGQNLRMVAQINVEELKGDIFPIKTGIIQFWALEDDMYGLDMNNRIAQDNSRVIYYPTVEECYTKEELEAKYPALIPTSALNAFDGFPFSLEHSFKLSAKQEKCPMPLIDFHFDEIFIEEYKKIAPKSDVESYWDFEDFLDDMFKQRSAKGHRLLGYPDFAQHDIRKDSPFEDYILLFQLDSDNINKKFIFWGDNGVANWFIHPDDLEKKDFSKVLYTWDCC